MTLTFDPTPFVVAFIVFPCLFGWGIMGILAAEKLGWR